MKQNILLIMALLLGGMASAQVEVDTTRFKIGNTEFLIIDRDTVMAEVENGKSIKMECKNNKDLTYWSGVEIGINLPMNGAFENKFASEHLNMDPSQSFVYHFNFFEKRIPIIKDYVGIVTGLGFTNSRFGLNSNQASFQMDSASIYAVVDKDLEPGYTKNQLRLNTFNIPLLLQINTSKYEDKNFHLAFGVIGGIRIGSNVKYKGESTDGTFKSKQKGRYYLNPFQLMTTVRMGYKDFGLFANYNTMTLFEAGKSENAYPLSFGVSFHF